MNQIEKYNQTNFIQNDLNSSIMSRYSDLFTWKNNETVLDIGMGDGKFTVQGLLPRLPKDLKMLIGCEYVPWKVEFASKTYAVPKVQFVELDIQTKDLREDFYEKFDHVFSFYVLQWVQDSRQALRNMYLMMKPGSEFFVVVSEDGPDYCFYNLSKKSKWAPYGHEKYISNFLNVKDRLKAWTSLLQDTGFIELNCFREYTVYRHTSKEVCEEVFKSLDPIVSMIPKDDLDEYCNDYVAELKKARLYCVDTCPETQEEICTSNFVTLIFYGKKPYSL